MICRGALVSARLKQWRGGWSRVADPYPGLWSKPDSNFWRARTWIRFSDGSWLNLEECCFERLNLDPVFRMYWFRIRFFRWLEPGFLDGSDRDPVFFNGSDPVFQMSRIRNRNFLEIVFGSGSSFLPRVGIRVIWTRIHNSEMKYRRKPGAI